MRWAHTLLNESNCCGHSRPRSKVSLNGSEGLGLTSGSTISAKTVRYRHGRKYLCYAVDRVPRVGCTPLYSPSIVDLTRLLDGCFTHQAAVVAAGRRWSVNLDVRQSSRLSLRVSRSRTNCPTCAVAVCSVHMASKRQRVCIRSRTIPSVV